MKHRFMSATEFKAKCLALLSEIDAEGATVTITKRGRPMAVVGPVRKRMRRSPEGAWSGKVQIMGDIVNTDTADLWEVVRRG